MRPHRLPQRARQGKQRVPLHLFHPAPLCGYRAAQQRCQDDSPNQAGKNRSDWEVWEEASPLGQVHERVAGRE